MHVCIFVYRTAVWCVRMCLVRVLPVCVQWPLLGSAVLSAQGFVFIGGKSISPAPPSLRPLTPAPHAPVWSVPQYLQNEKEMIRPCSWSEFKFFPTRPFTPSSDQNEVVNCQRRPCPVRCSHPVPSDTCCPVCDSCLYEGVVHSHSHTFTPSSNPCQRCTCVRGTVTCVPLVCPPTPCVRPVTKPGQCCPECTGTPWTVCVDVICLTEANLWPQLLHYILN